MLCGHTAPLITTPTTRPWHADPSITLRVYAHVVDQRLVKAAEILAKRVEEAALAGRC